jgi:hypothetical protein
MIQENNGIALGFAEIGSDKSGFSTGIEAIVTNDKITLNRLDKLLELN